MNVMWSRIFFDEFGVGEKMGGYDCLEGGFVGSLI